MESVCLIGYKQPLRRIVGVLRLADGVLMHSEFWHDKWSKKEIGFHLDEVNKVLLKYWPDMHLATGSKVLLPLCGKTLDLFWLRQAGYGVVGIELSEIALDELAAQLTAELDIAIEKNREGEQVFYRGDGVLLIAGDFFNVSRELLQRELGGDIDAVYDRAALVALPESMRRQYSQHLHALSHGAPQMLVTLDYDQSQMDGPPFALSDAEVHAHYDALYTLTLAEERELIEQEPRFKARGLTSFKQRLYFLR